MFISYLHFHYLFIRILFTSCYIFSLFAHQNYQIYHHDWYWYVYTLLYIFTNCSEFLRCAGRPTLPHVVCRQHDHDDGCLNDHDEVHVNDDDDDDNVQASPSPSTCSLESLLPRGLATPIVQTGKISVRTGWKSKWYVSMTLRNYNIWCSLGTKFSASKISASAQMIQASMV